jgi:hypothetical protein
MRKNLPIALALLVLIGAAPILGARQTTAGAVARTSPLVARR